MKLSIAAVLISSLLPFLACGHEDNGIFGWATLNVRLPKALSDHTATYSTDSGLIYIAGGCDSPKGNEFDGEFSFCASISDSLYSFDPTDSVFAELGSLPRQRYRHSASVVNNQLWLIGGRDASDALLAEVDVYDIASKEWTTYTLPEEYLTSDNAGFTGPSSFLYVAGGFNATYGALGTVFRIDATTPTSGADSTTLVVEVVAPLLEARGDVYAATGQTSASLGGGFTDANDFCAPLPTVESYNYALDQWSYLPNLIDERGEVVFVELDDHVYAMGGERQIEGICEITGDADPGELTVGTNLVEVLHDEGEWSVVDNFPSHKFRFAAVGVDRTGLIYAFGGQTAWDDSCDCFKCTDDIQVFGEGVEDSASAATGKGMVPSLVFGMVMAAMGIMF